MKSPFYVNYKGMYSSQQQGHIIKMLSIPELQLQSTQSSKVLTNPTVAFSHQLLFIAQPHPFQLHLLPLSVPNDQQYLSRDTGHFIFKALQPPSTSQMS